MNGIFNSDRVASAMAKVDRANYVVHKSEAYEDSPQLSLFLFLSCPEILNQTGSRVIGYGATISAPHMHAYASEHLLEYLRPGSKVLDVGSGSGYLVAVLHHLVSPGEGGKVVGIEHVEELVDWSKENLVKDGLKDQLESKTIQVVAGDGRKGFPSEGPYDAIHVGAAAPTVPEALIEQLASPGRMFIPVGTALQNILHVDKDADGKVTQKEIMSVRVCTSSLLPLLQPVSRFLKNSTEQAINHTPGYRPPFGPLDFPGVVLPTRWWNTGLDVHYMRRYDMYKTREHTSIVPFISGTPSLWTNNLDVARQIESGGARGVFRKPLGSMRALRLWGPNLAASNGEQWRKHRRVMGPAFNQKLYTVVWKKTREIYREMVDTPEWKNSKEDGVTFEPVQGMTYKLALIILGSCGFGLPGSWTEPPRTQTDDPKAMTVQYALRTVADSSGLIIFAPEWVKRLPFHRIQEPQQALVQLSGFMQEQIRIRKSEEKEEEREEEGGGGEGGVGKNNVLTLLVQASEDEEGKYQLEDEELIGNVFLLLLAGHGLTIVVHTETTANALAGTFGFLAAHPEIQKEVYDHIVDVVGMERDPTFEDYSRLNKVAAAFLEAVRFFPGGHVLIREAGEDTIVDIPADPKTGKEKESIPVAKGVNVIVDMIGIHRNPRYFDEPDEYRPSRWYNVSSDSDVFTGFSVGPRACIGRKFATVEAVCWLTMILRDFEVRPAGLREGETVAEWERRILVPNFTLTLGVGDVPVRFVRRR
ncbi:hypothetical protein V5O48_016877 [Marasmius crinis-equi]|uniref:protein-L-isoaspartate(D-aspartate) O-methyltransferase n=1 Tax=Marasmius crinis-equi TaxID=585013 RepID=A0ABR3EQJ0_9AGAR